MLTMSSHVQTEEVDFEVLQREAREIDWQI